MRLVIYFLNGTDKRINEYYLEKEYRDDIVVELNDLYYELYFYTPDSLEYEMTNEGYFSLPGLIILDEISIGKIKKSIINLLNKGYFGRFKGKRKLSQENRFIHDWYSNELLSYDILHLTKEEISL